MKTKRHLLLGIILVSTMATSILSCAPIVGPVPATPEEEIQVEEPGQTTAEAEALERYEFAIEALQIWDDIKAIAIDAFELFPTFESGVPCSTEATNLMNRLYTTEHRLKWLYVPPDAVQLKDSLFAELDIVSDCIVKLSLACSSSEHGNATESQRFYSQAVEHFVEFIGEEGLASKKIERDLINFKLQAEKDLGWR